jgi:hypothetical protein
MVVGAATTNWTEMDCGELEAPADVIITKPE